jgi:hypothetical protein
MECRFDFDADSNRFSILRGWLKTPILERTHSLGRKAIIIALNKYCPAYLALLVDYGVKLHRPLLVDLARFIGVSTRLRVSSVRVKSVLAVESSFLSEARIN